MLYETKGFGMRSNDEAAGQRTDVTVDREDAGTT